MKTAEKKRRREAAAKGLNLPPDWTLSRRRHTPVLQARALAELPWLTHGFSTRVGGQSERDGKRMLNLGFTDWDEPSRVEKNRRQFFAALGARGMEPFTLRQIHSSVIHFVRRENHAARRETRSGDALATRARGLLLTVRVADCVPILLADSRKRAVAAIHAGWRGTVRRIAEKAVGDLRVHFGTRPQDLLAAIGPAIGVCCYEVGPDVAQEFGSQFTNASDWFEGPFEPLSTGDEPTPFLWLQTDPPGHDRPKRAQLNLAAANRWQLEHAGVKPDWIFSCGLCTSCKNDWFFSYRREGRQSGSIMAAIGVK